MKRKILFVIVLFVLLITSCTKLNDNDVKQSPSEEIVSYVSNTQSNGESIIELSELSMTEEELFNAADLIVTGKINKGVNHKTHVIKDKKSGKEIATAELMYLVLKVDESFKNPNDLKKVNIVVADGVQIFNDVDITIKEESEYLLYLQYNEELEAYNLLSYSEGVYRFIDKNKIESVTGEFEYSAIKDKIKKIKDLKE